SSTPQTTVGASPRPVSPCTYECAAQADRVRPACSTAPAICGSPAPGAEVVALSVRIGGSRLFSFRIRSRSLSVQAGRHQLLPLPRTAGGHPATTVATASSTTSSPKAAEVGATPWPALRRTSRQAGPVVTRATSAAAVALRGLPDSRPPPGCWGL